MKKLLVLGILLFSINVFAINLHYDPNQLMKLQTTGSCEACDLTDMYVTVNPTVHPPLDLWFANLSGATIAVKNNTLSDLTHVVAINTIFGANDYSQVNFTNAVLIDANFTGANLIYTNFAGANVTGANFTNANLYGSQGINISQAYSVCNAILPDGSKGHC